MTDKVPTVCIAASALEAIRAEVTGGHPDLETGGILLGHHPTDVTSRRIVVAGDPGANAIHEPRRFHRDTAHARALADAAWRRRRAIWIGEWHTHPGGGLRPSEGDMRSYLTHLYDPDLGFDEFLSLIAARSEGRVALAAWLVTRTKIAATALRVIDDGEDTP